MQNWQAVKQNLDSALGRAEKKSIEVSTDDGRTQSGRQGLGVHTSKREKYIFFPLL